MSRKLSKHHCRIKGQDGEEFLHGLAEDTFLADWCYTNPKLPTKKELCDLLVVDDCTAIIWQAKNLKLGKDGALRKSEAEKNIRQLSGARRQLFDLKIPVTLQNSRRVSERFEPGQINEVFLISVLLGDRPDHQDLITSIKDYQCHVFTREFVEIVLNELDTVSDFCGYLREIERVRGHVGSLILEGGQEELLGYYLLNERSLADLEGHDAVFLQGGSWEEIQRRPEYQAKRSADEISYLWDEFIDRAHTGDSVEYERIARELARPSRFERRCLATFYSDARVKARDISSSHNVFRRADAGKRWCVSPSFWPCCWTGAGRYRSSANLAHLPDRSYLQTQPQRFATSAWTPMEFPLQTT